MAKAIGFEARVVGKLPDPYPPGVTLEYSFAGAYATLGKIKHPEGYIACHLRLIAVHLYKASKVIAPTKLSWGPNDVIFFVLRNEKVFSKGWTSIDINDLAELEDLYYATCAKLQERLHEINIRLANGFIHPGDDFFKYDSKGLDLPDPIKAGAWKATLAQHEKFLYDPLVEGIMNRAVLVKQKRNLEAKATLPISRGTNKVCGLRDVRNMACGMIFGGLAEKYRTIVKFEEFEKTRAKRLLASHPVSTHEVLRISNESIPITLKHSKRSKANNMATNQASHVDHHDNTAQGEEVHERGRDQQRAQYHETKNKTYRHISIYNLEEPAKKVNRVAPEMACMCDQECKCAALCTLDPTENCPCKEKGLFRRGTESMDIDEASYPTKTEEDEEAEKAGKEYMAEPMTVGHNQQQAFEYASVIEQYSTLEPVEVYPAPVDGKGHMAQSTAADRAQRPEFEYSSTVEQFSTLEPVEVYPVPIDGKGYVDEQMAVDRDQHQQFEYPSTIEQYSTLEPVEAHPAPVDRMQLDPPPYDGPRMADGSPDLAYNLRKILFGGSLSIYAVDAPNGERVRDLSCHWHDDMRATIEAQILASPPDPDFRYPNAATRGISQARLNLAHISSQFPTTGQRLMRFTRESIGLKTPPQMMKASRPSPGRTDGFDLTPYQGVQKKPQSKVSLFASRLIGRSSQAQSRTNGGKPMDVGQPRQ
ncbi:MAG: hypothetical protein Q9191_004743 [Dirinaria sp. TL-2023a]